MAKKKTRRRSVRVEYHHPELQPAELLHFIELDEFSDDWRSLQLDDEDLLALQVLIMLGPERAAVIEGTGGLRKIRFSPLRWNTGKSGALRVCFAWFPKYYTAILVTAYAKNEQDDLDAGDKSAIAELLKQCELALAAKFPKAKTDEEDS